MSRKSTIEIANLTPSQLLELRKVIKELNLDMEPKENIGINSLDSDFSIESSSSCDSQEDITYKTTPLEV